MAQALPLPAQPMYPWTAPQPAPAQQVSNMAMPQESNRERDESLGQFQPSAPDFWSVIPEDLIRQSVDEYWADMQRSG